MYRLLMMFLGLFVAGCSQPYKRQIEVPPEIEHRVRQRIAECMWLLRSAFEAVELPEPGVMFVIGLVNPTTGKPRNASYNKRENIIRLNAETLMQHPDEFIHQSVAHECAHVLEETIDPAASHGQFWELGCRILGIDPIVTTTYGVEKDEH